MYPSFRFMIYGIFGLILLEHSSLFSSNDVSDYDQFLLLENLPEFINKPCHEDQAYQFLLSEIALFKIIQNNQSKIHNSSSCLMDAAMELYCATQIAEHSNIIQINTFSQKSSWQEFVDFYISKWKQQEMHLLMTCPVFVSSWIIELKARRALSYLQHQKLKTE